MKKIKNGLYAFKLSWTRCDNLGRIPLWVRHGNKAKLAILQFYVRAQDMNLKNKKVKYQVDHVIPLTHPLVCGLHCPENLQILTEKANKQKSNTFTNLIEYPKT